MKKDKVKLEKKPELPKKDKQVPQGTDYLACIHKDAAGVDIGSREHYVAVPVGRDNVSVRSFQSFTSDLHSLCEWLTKCRIKTVAMESTGVYWIPLYEILEARGFEVVLVNSRHVKNVSGRKTDVVDCQWLQQLHTFGLLAGSFRPAEQVCELRAYHRQREMLIQQAATHIQHMQKSLSQMNIQLHHVLSDITGQTGMKIIHAILEGERDVKKLSRLRDGRCKNPVEIIEKALEGHYKEEHLFSLKQAVELIDVYHEKLRDCDKMIEQALSKFDSVVELSIANIPAKKRERSKNLNTPAFDLHSHLYRMTGVDLTAIPGINSHTAFKVVSEIGLDLTKWATVKHFASWLGLCPGNKISGGKRLSGKTKPCANRAAAALRMAAVSLERSRTALGAFYRRQKTRLGAPKAITATAHKLACLIYNLLTRGIEYVEQGMAYYEEKYQERVIRSLRKKAHSFGLKLVQEVEK